MSKRISLYQHHVNKWSEGCGSELCGGATRKVFLRGVVPCDVLFIGEAPGMSEDVLGRPFVGPAGKLMDEIIRQAFGGYPYTYALTNLVCCIPRDPEDLGSVMKPPDEAVKSCQPRLLECIELCNPRLVVCVGKLSSHFTDSKYKGALKLTLPREEIDHPASILRASIVHKGMMVQKAVVTLRHALEELNRTKEE